MEQEAGADNNGVRLALYFQRVAPTVKTPYGILADRALLQVVHTALALPVTMSNADIDVQANMISKKLNLKDLRDPKKLQKFIAQFSALYDLNNSDKSTLAGDHVIQPVKINDGSQWSLNSEPISLSSAGRISSEWATVTRKSLPSSLAIQKSRNDCSFGKRGAESYSCQMYDCSSDG